MSYLNYTKISKMQFPAIFLYDFFFTVMSESCHSMLIRELYAVDKLETSGFFKNMMYYATWFLTE